jgi:SynChlorMet cassette protein ScmD
MKPTDRPLANPSVVLREEFDDWAVLFNPDNANAAGTNPVGVAVWKQLDGRQSVDTIAAVIANDFADAPDTALRDVTAFVDTLAEFGFAGLELHPASGM